MVGYESSAQLTLATYSANLHPLPGDAGLHPDEALLQRIIDEGVRGSRSKGDFLCRQGAVADEVHALVSGAAGVSVRSAGARAHYHFFLFAPFLVIPAVSAIGRAPLSIECLVPCEIYTISRRTMARLVEEGEIARSAIELNLARMLDLANEHLANLLCRTGAGRVAHMLSMLAATLRGSTSAQERDASEGIAIELTQVQLASALGMSPVYLNQIIKTFKEEGIISTRSGRLIIEKQERLEKYAKTSCEL